MPTRSLPLIELLSTVDVPACEHFRPLLRDALKPGSMGDEAPFAEQLAHACALVLRATDAVPFVPLFEGASKAPSEFTEEEIHLLLSRVDELCPELRARVYDLVWEARRDPSKAILAIGEYQQSARTLARSPKGSCYARDNLARAVAIAARMKKRDLVEEVVNAAVELVTDVATTESARITIARFLVENEKGDPAVIADLLRPIVENEHAQAGTEDGGHNWDWLRGAWKLLADAERGAGRGEAATKALLERAETYSTQARWLATRKGASAMLGAHLLREGIEALRQLPGTEERRNELLRDLREVQKKVIEEMQEFHGPSIDLTEAAHNAIDAVSGLRFREALFALVRLGPIPGIEQIRQFAHARAKQSPLMTFVPRAIVDADGRLVRHEPAARFDDPTSGPAALRAEMIRVLADLRGAFVTGLVDPARRQIASEHAASLADWLDVLADSPIVDGSRARTWIRGLDAGLRGDFIVSSYLLVPQIEHALRLIVASTGVLPEWIAPDGVQQYKLLSAILEEPALKKILGESLHFEIDALLTKEGENFRNLLAHGLFSDGAVASGEGVYIWHLALRIVLLPIIVNERRTADAHVGDGGA